MSTTAVVLIAVVALLAWCALLDAVKESLALRAKALVCPCRDLHSMTLAPGAVFELPAGTDLSAATHPEFVASFSTKGTEAVREAFEDAANSPAHLSPAGERAPRMSEHELVGLYQDLAKVDRLRKSGSRLDLARARELRALVVEQAAAPAKGI